MVRKPQVFHTQPLYLRRVFFRLSFAWGIVMLIAYIWKPSRATVTELVAGGLVGVAARAGPSLVLMARRGLDTVSIDAKGLGVSRRKGAFQLDWSEISTVRRTEKHLVFEVGTLERQHTLYREAHAHHLGDLLEAVEKLGRLPEVADIGEHRADRGERRRR